MSDETEVRDVDPPEFVCLTRLAGGTFRVRPGSVYSITPITGKGGSVVGTSSGLVLVEEEPEEVERLVQERSIRRWTARVSSTWALAGAAPEPESKETEGE